MRAILLLLAVLLAASIIAYGDHRRRIAAAELRPAAPAAGNEADAEPVRRDPRLDRIVACDAAAMARAQELPSGWWGVFDDHHTAEGLPDAVLIARAESGDRDAMAVAGFALIMWEDPAGERDYEAEGMAWIERAAAAGDRTAQNELGHALTHGLGGLEADPEQARIWLEQAALGGDALASHTLAGLYAAGRLTPRDGETASATELALAAELASAQQCYVLAIDSVADRLVRGRLLTRDLVTAGQLRRAARAFKEGRG